MAGEILSLEVLTEAGKTFNLVYKICPDGNPMLRDYVIGYRIFNIEIEMYTTIRSALETLLSSRIGKTELPLPTYFDGLCDGADDFLCLEDLRPSGYAMPDKYKGLNVEQAELAMRELAKFHAQTYFLIKHEGESFFDNPSLKQYGCSLWLDSGNVFTIFDDAMEVALEVLDKNSPVLAKRFREKVKTTGPLNDTIFRTARRTDSQYFPVICHGDFWSNNVLFKYADDGDERKPVGIKFVDFQLAHRGNIFEELQYFVFTSTTPALRKEHLTRVLEAYYDGFIETLEELKFPRPTNFTKGYFFDHFYQTFLPALFFLPYAIPLQLGLPGEPNPKKPETLEEGAEIMVAELKAQWEGSPRAIQRMVDILQEFVDLKLM